MPFAIQLFFDPASDSTVRHLWAEIASRGLPFPLRDSGNRPHVSLAIYRQIDATVCADLLNSFAQTQAPFALSIASLGIFPGEQAVVFLAPIGSPHLFDLHRQVHQLFQDTGVLPSPYYLPGQWTPHCTLATRVPPQFLSQAVEVGLGMAFPLPISIAEIGVIEYPPVTHLFSFPLTGRETPFPGSTAF
jgi:2'-5' RNA ligase